MLCKTFSYWDTLMRLRSASCGARLRSRLPPSVCEGWLDWCVASPRTGPGVSLAPSEHQLPLKKKQSK